MKLRHTLLLLGLLILQATAQAESSFPLINSSTPLTLDSLIAIGYRNNPSLASSMQDTRLNSIGKLNAIGNFLPQVSVGMNFSESHYKNATYTNPDGSVASYPITTPDETFSYVVWDTAGDGSLTNPRLQTQTIPGQIINAPEGSSRSSSQFLSLNEELFSGGRRIFLYRMAKTQEKINNLSLLDQRKALASQIAQQMVLVLTQEKILDLDKKLRDQRKDGYDLAKARFEVGAVTELDVLQTEIEMNKAENTVKQAERDVQSAREDMNKLLGIDLRSSYPIAEADKATPYKFEVQNLIEAAYKNRTDLAIAELSIKRAKHNLWMSKTAYLPTINLGASWSRSEQSGTSESWTLSPSNSNTSYSLSLRWNIFDGFSREFDVVSKRVARDKAVEQERELRLNLDKQVRSAYNNLQSVFDQLQITDRNRDLADRNLNLERERYRLGATSALGLRDAQVTYAQAETANLQKQLEYQSSLIALELAVGKKLR